MSLKSTSTIYLIWKQLRPQQWSKNVLLFSALLFAQEYGNINALLLSVFSFFAYSLTASSIYIFNDYKDIESDRNHPVKRYRPMASGLLKPKLALGIGAVLLLGSLSTSFIVNPIFFLILIVYFVTNIMYSLYLKHVVIIDMMIIAFGFVLRAIGGAVIIEVPFTPWFLLCAMLLSLFLAIGKRRHELVLSMEENKSHRKVLENYSLPFLDQLISIVSSATIVSYAVFTFTSRNSPYLMWTIPFVIYGIFRYLYLIHIKKLGGAPEKILLEDKHILATVILYTMSVIVILTYFS
ncbi:decaprenyl-phosphate phosphoribosyltransferase [Salinibacillus aidingensis]